MCIEYTKKAIQHCTCIDNHQFFKDGGIIMLTKQTIPSKDALMTGYVSNPISCKVMSSL